MSGFADRRQVLIVEDDADIRELVRVALEREGFEVREAASAREGRRALEGPLPDLVVLDLMLPDVPGLELCRSLRAEEPTRHLPLVILTARAEESDVVLGLELGADDYVTKPFSVRELVSRVRAVLRRASAPAEADAPEAVVRVGDLEVDSVRFEARVAGVPVALTPAEFRLLRVLASHPGQVMSRDRLLDHITEGRSIIIDRNVDVHVRALRKKLGPAGRRIVTVRGVGYKCEEN